MELDEMEKTSSNAIKESPGSKLSKKVKEPVKRMKAIHLAQWQVLALIQYQAMVMKLPKLGGFAPYQNY